MTIKEIEIRSGMERANIRFYEREGLITPKREDNGYRDYSEGDLQVLLRIKLLRSLHISLNEIKALQDGSSDLSDTLAKQIKNLEQEKQDVSYAQEVCRAMQDDRASYATLDAAKYLEGIHRVTEESGSPYFTVKGDELPQVFYPWRRFFARAFDLFIYRIPWEAFLAFAFHINLTDRSAWGNLFDTFIAIVIMLFIEPLWLHLFGTTPGKAIFGLRIENADGRQLSYSEGLERTWGVISTGLGFNIPIYNLVRLWKSYKICSENEMQPWDELISYTIKDRRWYRNVLFVGAYAAAFGILLMIHSAQLLPPNRGDLTIAQFVENYNYYAEFFDISFGNKELNEVGKWVEREFNGTAYIEFGCSESPEFHFSVEKGYVKGVSFLVEIENNPDWLGSYDTQMLLASLAFVDAQREIGLFSKAPARMAKQIENNSFQDFHFTEAGITVTCDTEYSGYINTQSNLLLPEENATANYYRLSFSMMAN
ncbi:MAG: MerR family transcriptional regulator [Lachnospiraceae bacterium]|nr:MerR family transcriptional regulator [Lachnospiraceae bacterium]